MCYSNETVKKIEVNLLLGAHGAALTMFKLKAGTLYNLQHPAQKLQ